MLIRTVLNSWMGTRDIETTLRLQKMLRVLWRLVMMLNLSCTILKCCLLLLILRSSYISVCARSIRRSLVTYGSSRTCAQSIVTPTRHIALSIP